MSVSNNHLCGFTNLMFQYSYLDVDECAQNNPCGSAGACVDTNGSYVCMCQEGYTFNSVTCIGE